MIKKYTPSLKNRVFIALLLLSSLLLTVDAFSQVPVVLGGTYTVGGVNPNFPTLDSVAKILNKQTTVVSQPVIFKIRNGVYNSKFTLKLTAGTSPVNTITFTSESGDSSKVVIRNSTSGFLANNHTIRLDGASNLIFRKLTVENLGTSYASAIHLTQRANNNRIENCVIRVGGGSNSLTTTVGILSSGYSMYAVDTSASDLRIVNNRIVGGYSNIRLYGANSTLHDLNIVIDGNILDSAYYYGIYTQYVDLTSLSNNRIKMRPGYNPSSPTAYVSPTGIYCYYSTSDIKMLNNEILNAPYMGMYFQYVKSASAGTRGTIANNRIGGNFYQAPYKYAETYGAYFYYCSNIDIAHNSIAYNTNNDGAAALYMGYGNTGVNVLNNILASFKDAMAYSIVTAASVTISDNNVLYTNGQYLTSYVYEYQSSLVQFQAISGKDLNSVSQNPGFVSNTDLHITNKALDNKGTPVQSVITDMDQESRHPFAPDPGADEIIMNDYDVALYNLKPVSPSVAANQVKVTLVNQGKQSLAGQTLKLSYSADGGTTWTADENYSTVNLNSTYKSEEFTFSTLWNPVSSGNYELCVRIKSPGHPNDTVKSNDQLCRKACAGFVTSGTYTVGGAGADFQTVGEAITAISCGIIGSVTFNINPGTYLESLTIPLIPGSSQFATVTFQSATGNAPDVIIKNVSALATIMIKQADFIRLKNLTIENTLTDLGSGIYLADGADNNIISNCKIILSQNTLEQASCGILSSSSAGFGTAGLNASNTQILNNRIVGGYSGIYLVAASNTHDKGNIITGNQIDSVYYYGINLTYNDFTNMDGNSISFRATSSNYGTGVYCSSTASDFSMSNNKIHAPGDGIYLYNMDPVSKGDIINNMVSSGYKYASEGIGFSGCTNLNVYHNSIYAKAGSYGGALSVSYSNASIRVQNNIIYSKTGPAYYISDPANLAASDNNIFYSEGPVLIYADGKNFNSLAAFSNLMGWDKKSAEENPMYVSATDLHASNMAINNKGLAVASVTKDIDNEDRHPFTPDPGADEFIVSPFDLGLVNLQPASPVLGINQVKATLVNEGTSAPGNNSVVLTYSTDGGTTWVSPQTVSTNDIPNTYDYKEVTFSVPWTLTQMGTYNLCARINPPGLAADTFKSNESMCISGCAGFADGGEYTVGGANPDFQTIQEGIDALACGITSSVTFKIRPGTYQENLVINPVLGASIANTIRFEGDGDAKGIKIVANGGPVVFLNGADYVTFRNLTVINKYSDAGDGFLIKAGADNNIVENCFIYMDSNSTSYSLYGIRVAGDYGESGGSNNIIRNNLVSGSGTGIYVYDDGTIPASGNVVTGNTVTGSYDTGIDASYSIQEVSRNKVIMRPGNTYSYGISVRYVTADVEVSGNYVADANYYGIYLYYLKGAAGINVSNNTIIMNSDIAYPAGLTLYSCSTVNVYHNSVQVSSKLPPLSYYSSAALEVDYGNSAIKVKDNNLSHLRDGYAYYVYSTTAVTESDYNNFYTEGSSPNFVYWGGNKVDLTALKAASGKDLFSLSTEPGYYDDYDLHTNNPTIDAKGAPAANVTKDYDNEDRDPQTPDIGSDEFESFEYNLGVTDIVTKVLKIGDNTIEATIKNLGINSLNGNTIKMSYSADGGTTWTAPEQFSINSLDAYNKSQLITFTAKLSISQEKDYNLCVRVNAPGILNDGNPADDKKCEQVCTGLAGTYTIGGAGSDFQDLDAAIQKLGCGLGGAVTFKLRPAIYNQQLILSAYTNISPVNTLTIESESGKAEDVTIIYEGVSSSSHAVVQLNGAKYVTIRNITLINSGTYYGTGVHLTNDAAFNRIEGCEIELEQMNSSGYYLYGIAISSATSPYSSGRASMNTVEKNHITGGYTGVFFYGVTGSDTFNRVINNTIDSSYNRGIEVNTNDGIVIQGNKIHRRSYYSGGAGIYVGSSAYDVKVTDNSIRNCGTYGIYLSNLTSSGQNLIANNMIAGGFTASSVYGMYVTSCKNMDVLFNSVSCDNSLATSNYAFYLSSSGTSTGLNIQNNIFSSSNGYAYYIGKPAAVSFSDNNDYFTQGASLAYWTTPQATLADLQTANGLDGFSQSIEPFFKAADDLHIINPALDKGGVPSPFVTTDIDGTPRDTQKPDIGCDEFIALEYDLAIAEVKPIIAKMGDNTVTVTLTSVGIQSLKDSVVSLSYSVDSGQTWTAPETLTITALQKPFDKEEFSFQQLWNVNVMQDYSICVRVNAPGIVLDTMKMNEVFCQDICVGVTGTFTVGGTAPDFISVGEAINSIYCGLAGPIVIKVRPGTYPESFSIPQFKNASAVNTLTIESETGNPDDVIIKRVADPTSSNFAVIQLNGSDYTILKDLTIVNNTFPLDTTAGVRLVNRANNNEIRNCRILMDTTSSSFYSAGILSSTVNTFVSGALSANHNRMVNNRIKGGSYGILLQGTNSNSLDIGNSIDSNIIQKSYYAGIQVRYTNMADISYNRIDCQSSIGSIGISCFNNVGNTQILNNYITGADHIGMEFSSSRGSQELLVANNMIASKFKSALNSESGIYTTSSSKISFYNNSIYFDGSPGNAAIEIGSGSGIKLKNNNLCNFSSGYALYISSSYITAIEETDYNNFYTNGTNLTYWGANQPTLASHKTTTSKDVHSISTNPLYVSSTDLHTVNPNLDKKGVSLPQVTIDFDGEKRSPLRSDIGADEFILTPNDMAILDVSPKVAVFGSNKVRAVMLNEGFASLKDSAVSLSYSTDGGTTWSAPEQFISDSLIGAYDRETFEFSAPWTISVITGYELCVRINTPGLLSDTVKWNEIACDDVCVGIDSGTYTVGGPGSDFLSFTDVLTSLSCGILGPVVFNVTNGTYNERISIPALPNMGIGKTIKFRSASGNPDSVVLISAGGGSVSDHHTLQLNGASYVTFENITIKNTSSGSSAKGSVVHLTNGAHHNTFRNCRLYADSTSISFSLFNIIACDITGMSNGTYTSNNTIENCYLSGGFDGIRILGNGIKKSTGNKIINNTIRLANVAGIDLQAVDVDQITQNRIVMRPTNIFNVGILIKDSRSDYSISGNYIYKAGSTGIYLEKVVAKTDGLIANNMLAGGFESDGENDFGIALINSSKASLIHNTIRYDGDTSSASAICLNNSYGIQLMNNIVSNSGNGYAYYVQSPGGIISSDYNDLYTKGANLVSWGGASIPNLTLFKALSTTDQHSISVNPAFKGAADVHTEDPALNGGAYPTIVESDYDGEARDNNTPDIGADEFTPLTILDGSTSMFLSPLKNGSVKGPVTVKIRVKNLGTSNINGTDLSYTINSGTPVVENYNGTIAPGDSMVYTFATRWYPGTFGNFNICAKTHVVNDVNTGNDALCINVTSLDTTDGGVTSLVSPVGPITTAGDQEVKVAIRNFGNTKIGNFQVSYKVNANLPVKEQYTDSIMPGATVNYTFTKKWTPASNGAYNICSYTDVPLDSKAANNNTCKIINVNASALDTLDASVNRFISPLPNSTVNDTADVRVKIYNKGNKAMSNFNIVLKVNNVQAAQETVTQSIAKGDSLTYTFTYKLNPIWGATYCLDAYTTVVNDNNHGNDTAHSCVTSPVGIAVNQGMLWTEPYPNPSNGIFNFDIRLFAPGQLNLELTDLFGKSVLLKEFGRRSAGEHHLELDAVTLAPGTYLYRVYSGMYVRTGKIVLIR